MIRTYITMLLLCCASTHLYAQGSVKFSSAYTKLSTDCQWAFQESELQEGQDNSLTCRGHGGYTLQIDAAGMYSTLHVMQANSELPLPRTLALRDSKNGMIEWRMANAKPFALIVRSQEIDRTGSASPERLVVLGLKGFESINAAFDTKGNAHANEQARTLADAAFGAATAAH